jgi:glycosyltransferase involved in cell wall biosynthesis
VSRQFVETVGRKGSLPRFFRVRRLFYELGRRILPVRWRRALRRGLPIEQLFAIRKDANWRGIAPLNADGLPAGRPDLIFLPVISWFYRKQRPQQLAAALARRGKRVFYLSLAGGIDPADPVSVAPGVNLIPLKGVRWEDPPEGKLGGRTLDAAFTEMSRHRTSFGLHAATLVLESPYWTPLALRLREEFGWKVVFDCLDDYRGFSKNRGRVLLEAQSELIREADLVFVTSEVLQQTVGPARRDIRLLPNACDYGLFSTARMARRQRDSTGPPTVGYIGALEDWFDIGLLRELAARRPDWIFEIVGAVDTGGFGRLGRMSNVRFHGERPHSEMPSFLARFDVLIIPFRLTPLTHATDPVKLYEALAAGCPIVGTPLRQLKAYERRGLLRLAGTATDFETRILECLGEAEESVERGRAFARQNTWSRRAVELDWAVLDLYPLISLVVIAVEPNDPKRLVELLTRRAGWPRCELIVVGNGFGADFHRTYLGVPVRIVSARTSGLLGAIRAGLRAARGEFLCVLEGNVVVTEGWLPALLRHLEQNPEALVVGPSTNADETAARVDVGYTRVADLQEWARRFTDSNRGRAEGVEELSSFCALFRRSLLEDLESLDRRLANGQGSVSSGERITAGREGTILVARDAFVHREADTGSHRQ